MAKKYISLTRHTRTEHGSRDEYFSYTKAQWRLAWLAVFVIGVVCGALRGCF